MSPNSGSDQCRALEAPCLEGRVLVFDENQNNAIHLANSCSGFGLEAKWINNISDLHNELKLALIAHQAYDLVLLCTPQEFSDVIPTFELINDNPEYSYISIVAIASDDKYLNRCKVLGAKSVIKKPIELSELRTTLQSIFKPSSINQLTSSKRFDILVVEDNKDEGVITQESLQEQGHRVSIADSGKAALLYLGRPSTHCNLIIMDLDMPEMDGIEATALLRAREEIEKLTGLVAQSTKPITVIGIAAENPDPDKLKTVGIDNCFLKPLNQKDLLSLLEKI